MFPGSSEKISSASPTAQGWLDTSSLQPEIRDKKEEEGRAGGMTQCQSACLACTQSWVLVLVLQETTITQKRQHHCPPSVDFQASYCRLSSPSPALSPGCTFSILCQGQAAQQLTSLAVGHAASLLPASPLEPLVQRKFLLLGSFEADAGVPH